MSVTVIDYGSGNLRSAAKALEAAVNNIKINEKKVVSSDPKVIKESKKIILPGQGSFRDCYLGIKKISGLEDALNEFVLFKKKPPRLKPFGGFIKLYPAVRKLLPRSYYYCYLTGMLKRE